MVKRDIIMEKKRTHLPRNTFIYGSMLAVLRIIRALGIETILDSLFTSDDRNVILSDASARIIRSIPINLVRGWYVILYILL